MGWALAYLTVGLVVAEIALWSNRRSGRRTIGGTEYLIAFGLWPIVFLVMAALKVGRNNRSRK